MRSTSNQRMRAAVLGVLGIVLFVLLWEGVVRFGLVSTRTISPPSQVLNTFLVKLTDPNPDGATFLTHFSSSIQLALSGFLTAVAIGVPLGLCMGYFKITRLIFGPVFEIIRPIPPIAWIPIIILFLGIGMAAKTFIVFVAAFVPCVINSYTGVKTVNPVFINVAKTLGASHYTIFARICIPAAFPMIFTGVRISLGASWTTLVAAEMLASTSGLGYMIQMGRTIIRPDIIIVGMLAIGCTGAFLSFILTKIENRIAPWRRK